MVHRINQNDRNDNSFDNALQSMRVDGGSRGLPNKFSLVATRDVHHGLNGFIPYSGRTRDVRGVLYIYTAMVLSPSLVFDMFTFDSSTYRVIKKKN